LVHAAFLIFNEPVSVPTGGLFFCQEVGVVAGIVTICLVRCRLITVFSHSHLALMPKHAGFNLEARGQCRTLRDAHEHISEADAILAGLPEDLGGRKQSVRALLRTIGRLLDEAGTRSICTERARSYERTNRELRGVLSALDTPADRRAFDINAEVQTLITSEDFETNDLVRERLRQLRDVLNSQCLD
jgi:hypothetical protein